MGGFKAKKEAASISKVPKDEYLPLVSAHAGYELVALVNRLKKAPQVTGALKTVESQAGAGAGADIFSDFVVGPPT